MQKEEKKVTATDQDKVCPACNRKPYSIKKMSAGVCNDCRSMLAGDIRLLYKCAEEVASAYGHTLSDIYVNRRTSDIVSARRLIATTCLHMSNAKSREVASFMRSRGKEIGDSSVRHLVLVARDLYDVSKTYRDLLDKFMLDTLRKYLGSSDNLLKMHNRNISDVVSRILIEEGICNEESSLVLAEKIVNAIEIS